MRSGRGGHAAMAAARAALVLPALAALAWAAPDGPGTAPASPAVSAAGADRIPALWQDVATDLEPALAPSRRVLLGNRDPRGPSCVEAAHKNRFVAYPGGGPGTRIASLYVAGPRPTTPLADFIWHQTTFKAALEEMRAANAEVVPAVVRLADRAESLARALAEQAPPLGAPLAGAPPASGHWPGYCARSFHEAMAYGAPVRARLWAEELASALAGLADLHRWLEYLLENQLASLAFQDQCRTLFEEAGAAYGGRYAPLRDISMFPAGRLGARGPHNYLEVERQAERVFRVPTEYFGMGLSGTPAVRRPAPDASRAGLALPPDLRDAFEELRGHLSAANRETWDAAARSPYRRTYLANMLYRAARAGVLDEMGLVLDRLDRSHPRALPSELMDVLFYRGGEPVGGSEWGDRFSPHLMKVAAGLGGSDEEVLGGARRFTRSLFGGWENYGVVDTLQEALARRRLDCLLAADMVGSLYRNAGRPGPYSVRWCAGTAGHSVIAAEVRAPGGPAILLADGLDDPDAPPEFWPHAYARGHDWPAGYTGDRADLYAVELYARGLDNYVWVEGYIIRGPNAGMLISTSVPYLPTRMKARVARLPGVAAPPLPLAPARRG